MAGRPPQELSFQQRVSEATGSLEGLEQGKIYDTAVLFVRHKMLADLADEGFRTGEVTQPESIELKLKAAQLAGRVAITKGDQIQAATMTQLEEAYTSLLEVLTPPEPQPSPSQTKPARRRTKTTKASTGKAKA